MMKRGEERAGKEKGGEVGLFGGYYVIILPWEA